MESYGLIKKNYQINKEKQENPCSLSMESKSKIFYDSDLSVSNASDFSIINYTFSFMEKDKNEKSSKFSKDNSFNDKEQKEKKDKDNEPFFSIIPSIKNLENFHEKSLWEKVLKNAAMKYTNKKLVHKNCLIIPFPENSQKFIYMNYFNSEIEKKLEKLENKYIIVDFIFKKESIEEIINFNYKRQEFRNVKKIERTGKLYIGINMKKFDEESYYVTYMIAEKNEN